MPEDVKDWIQTKLFDQAPISICVIDRDFRIVQANQPFQETYGPGEGRHCYEVYKGRETRCEACGAARTFADGEIRKREEHGFTRDGREIDYLVQITPLTNRHGEIRYVAEMSTDISAMKQLEHEKVEAERLAAVGQTVAGLAHGVKNIIMGLEGGMYVIGSGLRNGTADRIAQGWEMLEENVTRISAFVKEFLEFARGRRPKLVTTPPNQVAQKVVDLYRDTAAMAGITLEARLDESLDDAPLDEENIHVCLSNLVSNAIDACEMSDAETRNIIVSTRVDDGVLVYEVSDNGGGMDCDIKQKVFTSFFSTKGSDKGTGIGLLTTRKIVQEHGGAVSFDSTEGEGSVFRLELPLKHLQELAQANEESQQEGEQA